MSTLIAVLGWSFLLAGLVVTTIVVVAHWRARLRMRVSPHAVPFFHALVRLRDELETNRD